jgi:hypothetical protein
MIIEYQKFNFKIQAVDPLALPDYKGSTFRGAFGHAFRKVVCALRKNDCGDCILKTKCIYSYVFETSPSEGAGIMGMNKYLKIPHPFVIEPPEESRRIYSPHDILSFNLILIGRASNYLPYFVYTFDELGKTGIGKKKGRYKLLEVHKEGRIVYASEDKTIRDTDAKRLDIPEALDFNRSNLLPTKRNNLIILRFLTPARISYGRDLTVKLEFHILVRALLRRLCLLHYFHAGMNEPSWDHKQIIAEAEKVLIETDSLQWRDWERYSTRQAVRMKMGGLIGDIRYKGNIEPFMPILKAGEILHVGKGTSFGLGKYVLHN